MAEKKVRPVASAIKNGLALESLSVVSLIPYARNPRKHPEAQVKQIAASIREFGFIVPVLVDAKENIIAGHGRVLAAAMLGLREVPCIRASHLSEVQRRAFILADNKLTENGGWDDGMLRLEMAGLKLEGFDLALTGFGEIEIGRLLTPADGGEDPPAPPVPAQTIIRPGDVWLLGEHRLMCGDATQKSCRNLLFNGERADLCFTSPPYLNQRDYERHIDDWDKLMTGVFNDVPLGTRGQIIVNLGLIYLNGECLLYWQKWLEWMKQRGWRFYGWYVWDKGSGLPGDWHGRLGPAHEFIFHFNKETADVVKWGKKKNASIKQRLSGNSTMRRKDGKTIPFGNPLASKQPTKIPDSVIRVTRNIGSDGHPAQFPVALPDFILRTWRSFLTFDPFCGSGSTIIAAGRLDKVCYGMEIEPLYCDVAIRRWQAETGKVAVRQSDGAAFEGES